MRKKVPFMDHSKSKIRPSFRKRLPFNRPEIVAIALHVAEQQHGKHNIRSLADAFCSTSSAIKTIPRSSMSGYIHHQ